MKNIHKHIDKNEAFDDLNTYPCVDKVSATKDPLVIQGLEVGGHRRKYMFALKL